MSLLLTMKRTSCWFLFFYLNMVLNVYISLYFYTLVFLLLIHLLINRYEPKQFKLNFFFTLKLFCLMHTPSQYPEPAPDKLITLWCCCSLLMHHLLPYMEKDPFFPPHHPQPIYHHCKWFCALGSALLTQDAASVEFMHSDHPKSSL